MSTNVMAPQGIVAFGQKPQHRGGSAPVRELPEMIQTGLIPTARAVVDLNRRCNAKCRMCYYAHSDENWSKPLAHVQQELVQARARGNNSVDFTGGEPTVYPEMAQVIQFAESLGLHTCIITNGLALESIRRLVEAGCREWLVSIHGFEGRHDDLLGVKGAWDKLNRTIEFLNGSGCFVRVNCTLTRFNAVDLPALARYYLETVRPRIVNFINFNPHDQWGSQDKAGIFRRLNEVQIRVSEVAPHLKAALDLLNKNHLWANVRYFPFCALKGYETHICNNPQVMFDPYEWVYGVTPKTTEAHLRYGRDLQRRINVCTGACEHCGVVDVCGGLHVNYAKLHGDAELAPYSVKSDYPYFFKRDIEADILVPAWKPSRNLQRLLAELPEKTIPPYNLVLIGRQQSAALNRNAALERSASPYLIMIDDDVAGLPYGWNRHLIQTMKENREVLALSARLLTADGRPGKNTANNTDLAQPLVAVEMIPTACCIIRRTDVRFDERYVRAGWEDTDFFTQLKQQGGGTLAISNLVKVIHLNEEKNGGGECNRENERLFMAKWHGQGAAANPTAAPPPAGDDIQACLQKGQYQQAIALMEQRLAQGGLTAELCNNLGFACYKLGAKDKALACFHKAAILNPADRDAFGNFMDLSAELKQFGALESFLRQMAEANPKVDEFRLLLADCLVRQGKTDEARTLLRALVEANAGFEEARQLLAQIDAPARPAATPAEPAADGRAFNRAPHMTRRGCIDVGHVCDIDCQFCYHRFEERKQRRFLSKDEIVRRLERDREQYELTVTDFTGGEPTLHPDMVEIVRRGAEIGNRICLISHGQWRKPERIEAIIDAGLHEFLISIHGVQEDHDGATNPGAFEKIMQSIRLIERKGIPWRVNCVAHAGNMPRFADYARMISGLARPPRNANFIVFSPLAGWGARGEIDFQARHSDLAPRLREAIDIFTEHGIWVNVRYYPMCMLPGLEQHVTCFPQICYDPFEWDYRSYCDLNAETIQKVHLMGRHANIYREHESQTFHNTWSLMQSQRLYRKAPQCMRCQRRLICDGVAQQYRDRYGLDELTPQEGELIRDPIHYRRRHAMAVGKGASR